jgi:hypothetical protein
MFVTTTISLLDADEVEVWQPPNLPDKVCLSFGLSALNIMASPQKLREIAEAILKEAGR